MRRRLRRADAHIGAELIGDDRDPTAIEAAHLASCPSCFAANRRRRPFDSQLVAAARELVMEPLPREVLTVSDLRAPDRRSWWSPGGVVIGLALLATVGLAASLAVPRSGGAGATASPTPDLSHVVQVGAVTYTFGLDRTVMGISRTEMRETDELTSVDLGVFANGSSGYAMLCPAAGTRAEERFVFGRIDGTATYSGPAATGHSADDGTFLFVLDPGAPWARLDVKSAGGAIGIGQDPFVELAAQRGPAGCRVTE